MDINEAQEKVNVWIKQYGVRYFNELTNLAVLVEEVGELSRLMSRKYGEQSFKTGKEPLDIKEAISEELADILFVTICLSNQMNINLDEAFIKSIEKKTNRDHKRHIENIKLK